MALKPPSPTSKPTFWRIQNIKTDERGAAELWLQTQTKELDIPEGRGFSLAADGERTLCATLTSHEEPRPSNRSWHLDKDFIGFTPLSDPENANVDIVIVTGLGGHALGSFRSADGATAWLRDFAPADIPRARFITYGYDTTVVDSDSNQGVHDLAQTLLDGLAGFRQRTRTPQRPLVFICHSLGGVVLKEALVISSKATDKKHKNLLDIVTVTYGLIFMGVPNLGLKHNQLETVVRGRPNEGFVKDLLVRKDGEASQFLSYLTNEFSDLDKRRRLAFEIVSYYETVTSPTVMDSGDGRFVTQGPRELMVTRMSAERIGHHVRNFDHLSSNANHRDLVRFEHSSDGRYRSFLDKLIVMAEEAPQALQSRARSGCFGGELQVSQCSMPSIYLPFPRNRKFVGRMQELESLRRKLFLDRDCVKMAVVGLGGIGKTQTVLHFAYSVLDEHSDVSVFWVPVLSAETFERAYEEIARLLEIPCGAGGEDDVNELVRRHLSSREAGRWLMIVDNADDIGILEGATRKAGVLPYLPESELGSTIFTTRDSEIAQSLLGSDFIELAKLTQSEAVDVLEKTLVRKDVLRDEAATAALLAELDFLPLALTQATAYVNCNKLSLSAYLDLLRSTEENKVRVLSREMRDHTRYNQASNAVAKTWLVSFKQLIQRNEDAADLLRYMSCIEWRSIPQSILPSVEPASRMTEAIGALSSYSFITPSDNKGIYDMHRLVHVAARVWVREEGMLAKVQRLAVQHLSDIFPSDQHENRHIWRAYMPHAAHARAHQNSEPAKVWAAFCVKVGRCLLVDGRIRDAVSWLEESRDRRSSLPEDDSELLLTQHCLAGAYQDNGQVEDAVQLLEHVMAIRGRVLAEDHPSRLASQHELASAYKANGQVKEAVQLLEHVVAIEGRVLAEDHPDRLASQHELASAYKANGQVKEAVQLLEHVMAIRGRVLAEDHPDRLASQSVLASAYQANGQVKEAVQLLEHVMAICGRVLAEDHPSRLASQHELASAYKANGQVKEAVQLLEHVMVIQERVLAEDHPSRLASQHSLASAYKANGQVEEAVQLLEHVVAIEGRVLAEDHPSRLASQHNLASAYKANGQVKEAVQLLEHVMAIRGRVLAEDHPDRLASQHELASAYKANGQVKEAVQLLEHVVAIQERVLAEDHPSRLASQAVLASAYQANGQVKEAVQLLEHVVAIRGRVLSEDHPDRLASQRALARAYEGSTQTCSVLAPMPYQVNERSINSLSATSLAPEPEEALPHRLQSIAVSGPSSIMQVRSEKEGVRANFTKFFQKLKKGSRS